MSERSVTSTTPLPAQQIKREDYKAIKRMDKKERIYMRGYNAGLKAATTASTPPLAVDAEKRSQT